MYCKSLLVDPLLVISAALISTSYIFRKLQDVRGRLNQLRGLVQYYQTGTEFIHGDEEEAGAQAALPDRPDRPESLDRSDPMHNHNIRWDILSYLKACLLILWHWSNIFVTSVGNKSSYFKGKGIEYHWR